MGTKFLFLQLFKMHNTLDCMGIKCQGSMSDTPMCSLDSRSCGVYVYKMEEFMFFSSNSDSFKPYSVPARQKKILICVLQEQKEAAFELLDGSAWFLEIWPRVKLAAFVMCHGKPAPLSSSTLPCSPAVLWIGLSWYPAVRLGLHSHRDCVQSPIQFMDVVETELLCSASDHLRFWSSFSQSFISSLVFLMAASKEGDFIPCLKSWVCISVAEVISWNSLSLQR